MTDFEKEIAVLKEKISELELDLRNQKCEKDDEIKVSLEESVEVFLEGVRTYSLLVFPVKGVRLFENLEKDLTRHKKEREEDGDCVDIDWLDNNGWYVEYYQSGNLNLISRTIGNSRLCFTNDLETLYINKEPLPFLIYTVGQLKQIIKILEESQDVRE